MARITKETRDKIVIQALDEISNAINAKRKLVYDRWQRNEGIYYLLTNWESVNTVPYFDTQTRNIKWEPPRVDLGKGIGFVQTLLSKLDKDHTFEYKPTEIADTLKARSADSVRKQDERLGKWAMKGRHGKKLAFIYGRAIFEYYATQKTNKKGKVQYKSCLTPISPYNFLIDPSCGGLSLQEAYNCGHLIDQFPVAELKGKQYIQSEVRKIINEIDNLAYDKSISEIDLFKEKKYEALDMGITEKVNYQSNESIKMFKWYTTYKGERYYLFMHPSGVCVRIEKLEDVNPSFDPTDQTPKYPYWSYGTDPDIDAFWNLAPMDQVAGLFIMQNVAIEQMIENYYKINRPMKITTGGALTNGNDMSYYPDKAVVITSPTPGMRAEDFYTTIQTPELSSPLNLYQTLDNISTVESGATPGAKGFAEEDKVGIYEGNMQNVNERYALLDKWISDGYQDFAELHYDNMMARMTPDFAVSYIGLDGVVMRQIIETKDDITPFSGRYDFYVTSSGSDIEKDRRLRADRLQFISQNMPAFKNQEYAIELAGEAVGLDKTQIRNLMTDTIGANTELMARVNNDLQSVIAGKLKEPYWKANESYLKLVLAWYESYADQLSKGELTKLDAYINSLYPIISENIAQDTYKNQTEQIANTMQAPAMEPPGEVVESQEEVPAESEPQQEVIY